MIKMKNIFSNKITYVALAAISIFAVSLKVVAISHSKNNNRNTSSGIIASKDVPPVVPNTNEDVTNNTNDEVAASPETEFARLGISGDQIGFFSGSNSAIGTLYLIFLGVGMNISDSLTIGNVNRETPSYRIVKGDKHDWLVATRISGSGTGFTYHEDDWYVIDSKGEVKEVLSYPSSGNEVNGPSDTYIWSVKVLNEDKLDDSSVDIKRTQQKCGDVTNDSPGMYLKGINCTEESQITHYVWNRTREEFVIQEKS